MSLLARLWYLKGWLFVPLCTGIIGIFLYDALVHPVYQTTGTILFAPPLVSAPQESSETFLQRLAQAREIALAHTSLKQLLQELAPLAPVPWCGASTLSSSWNLAGCWAETSSVPAAAETQAGSISDDVERMRQAIHFWIADVASWRLAYRDRTPDNADKVVQALLALILAEDRRLRELEVERQTAFLAQQMQHLETTIYTQSQHRQTALQALEKLRASYDTLFRDLPGLARAEAAATIATQHYDVLAVQYRQILSQYLDMTRYAEALRQEGGRLRLASGSFSMRRVIMDAARLRCSVLLSGTAGVLLFLAAVIGSTLRHTR